MFRLSGLLNIIMAFRQTLYSLKMFYAKGIVSKIVNEYDQEIPQSQTADNPVAP